MQRVPGSCVARPIVRPVAGVTRDMRGCRKFKPSPTSSSDDEHATTELRNTVIRGVKNGDGRGVMRSMLCVDLVQSCRDEAESLVLATKPEPLDILDQKCTRPRLGK